MAAGLIGRALSTLLGTVMLENRRLKGLLASRDAKRRRSGGFGEGISLTQARTMLVLGMQTVGSYGFMVAGADHMGSETCGGLRGVWMVVDLGQRQLRSTRPHDTKRLGQV